MAGNAFANQDDVPAESAGTLVAYLASGAADVLSGRNTLATEGIAEMVARGMRSKSKISTCCERRQLIE